MAPCRTLHHTLHCQEQAHPNRLADVQAPCLSAHGLCMASGQYSVGHGAQSIAGEVLRVAPVPYCISNMPTTPVASRMACTVWQCRRLPGLWTSECGPQPLASRMSCIARTHGPSLMIRGQLTSCQMPHRRAGHGEELETSPSVRRGKCGGCRCV